MDAYAAIEKPVTIAVSSTRVTKRYGGLQLTATPAKHYYLNFNIPEVHHNSNVYCFKAVINDEIATATITCFSPKAHDFVPECNVVVNVIDDKDTYHLPDALNLPAPQATIPPLLEILQQTTSATATTAKANDPPPLTKDPSQQAQTSQEEMKKTSKKELFTDKKVADKKPKQQK
ncbi:hypothetical protein Tco_0373568 [Tanacetum coccineum]